MRLLLLQVEVQGCGRSVLQLRCLEPGKDLGGTFGSTKDADRESNGVQSGLVQGRMPRCQSQQPDPCDGLQLPSQVAPLVEGEA